MIIEFSVTNFRSFRERQTLSMVAGRLTDHEETHTFDPKLPGFDRLLAATALYGPNASGKTNLLRAVQTMQAVIVNSAQTNLVLRDVRMPFVLDAKSAKAPTVFEITFVVEGVRYDYGFELDDERVSHEWLIEYATARGRTLFERTYLPRTGDYDWQFSTFLKGQKTVWKDATRSNALFLSIAVNLNAHQLAPIVAWFATKLSVIVLPMGLNPSLTPRLFEQPGGKEKLLPFLREADFDISDVHVRRELVTSGQLVVQNAMAFENGPEGVSAIRVSFSHPNVDGGGAVTLEFNDESRGTQALFNAAGAWIKVLEEGEVILFDELETSLHPLIIRYLVSRFHSPVTNPRHAQLIFTTHNTSLLDMDVLRRDQIWFVERGRNSGSHLYPLTRFKPRQGEALERGYLRGRYGGLPIVDEPVS